MTYRIEEDFSAPLKEWIAEYGITELRLVTLTDRPFRKSIESLKLLCTPAPMTDLHQLRSRYLELTNRILPQIAKPRGFPVSDNHCFQRIILDNLLGQCWYEVLNCGKIPAYKQLTEEQLQQAIDLAEAIITRPNSHLEQLNQNSLDWRKERRSILSSLPKKRKIANPDRSP